MTLGDAIYRIAAGVAHHYKEIGATVVGGYLALTRFGGIRTVIADFIGVWPAGFTWKAQVAPTYATPIEVTAPEAPQPR